MPHYTTTLELNCPVGELFRFLSTTKHLVELAPAELNLELVSAPEALSLGAQLTWKGRRWGIAQQIVQEVTRFEVDACMAIEQVKGPLARWTHVCELAAVGSSARMTDRVEFEPPGGLLGRMISATSILKDIERLFAHRQERLRMRFVSGPEA